MPEGAQFDSVTNEGRILFKIGPKKVATVPLSDGYRSILALTGDLIWRLLQAFPKSEQPLDEHGVVLIDELDIHLHPTWQRTVAETLRELFPNLQIIVSTHSPLVAAGAGEDALTYRLHFEGGKSSVERVSNVAAMSRQNTGKRRIWPRFSLLAANEEENRSLRPTCSEASSPFHE